MTHDLALRLGLPFLNNMLLVIAEQFSAMPGAVFDVDDVRVEQFELAGMLNTDLMGSKLGLTRCLVQGEDADAGPSDQEQAPARSDITIWVRDSFLLDRVARGAIWHASTIGPVALRWAKAQQLRTSARLRLLPRLPGIPPADIWICSGRPLEEVMGAAAGGRDSDVVVRIGNDHLGAVIAGSMVDPSTADGTVRIEHPRVRIGQQDFEARFDARWMWSSTPCLVRMVPRIVDGRLRVELVDFEVRGFSVTELPNFAARRVRAYLDDRFERTVSQKADPWIIRRLPPAIGEYDCEITDVGAVEGGWAVFAEIRGLRAPDRAWISDGDR